MNKVMDNKNNTDKYIVTRNACKLCSPLGASIVLRGIENSMPILHGSQGCATYIRRYLISHFNEPIDIASSNFTESEVVFGGSSNLNQSLDNVTKQYEPDIIGVATTCLSETIGDDVPRFLREYKKEREGRKIPEIFTVSTPSYKGSHMEGFHQTLKAVVDAIPGDEIKTDSVNLFPGFISTADLRHLKEIFEDFGVNPIMLPDYSETLDGTSWETYNKISPGGTPVSEIKKMGGARESIEFGKTLSEVESAGKNLEKKFGVKCSSLGLPIGIRETDTLMDLMEKLSGKSMPEKYVKERERLIDAMSDGHKYVMGIKAVVYGEEDFVAGIASMLLEIGVVPSLCASGGKSGFLEEKIRSMAEGYTDEEIIVKDGVDFMDISEIAKEINPDMIVGNSKGYTLSRTINKPLVRVGFPIHDRIGGQRILHIGYRGAQQLFDMVTNTVIQYRQDSSPVGYTYM